MNKINGIFAIAHIENILKLWGHYSYDVRIVQKTKACWIQFAARSYYSGIDLEPRSTRAIFQKFLFIFNLNFSIDTVRH